MTAISKSERVCNKCGREALRSSWHRSLTYSYSTWRHRTPNRDCAASDVTPTFPHLYEAAHAK